MFFIPLLYIAYIEPLPIMGVYVVTLKSDLIFSKLLSSNFSTVSFISYIPSKTLVLIHFYNIPSGLNFVVHKIFIKAAPKKSGESNRNWKRKLNVAASLEEAGK